MNAVSTRPLAVTCHEIQNFSADGIPERDLALWYTDSEGVLSVVYWLSDGEVSSVPRHQMTLPALER